MKTNVEKVAKLESGRKMIAPKSKRVKHFFSNFRSELPFIYIRSI